MHGSFVHLVDAIGTLGERRSQPGQDAELAIKRARRIEHGLRAGLATLTATATRGRGVHAGGLPSYSTVGESLLRVADRTWYAVLKVL